MSSISTHLLDVSIGRPAAGVSVSLELQLGGEWRQMGNGVTDSDGRLSEIVADGGSLEEGVYRLTFDTGAYFAAASIDTFYPEVVVAFAITDASQHYHVPLLLSPFGYSTYRGS